MADQAPKKGRRWGIWLLYGLFGLVMFTVGLVWTFPVEALVQQVVRQVSDQSGWQVRAKGSTLHLPFTLAVDQLDLTPSSSDQAIELRKVNVALSPLKLRGGITELDLESSVLGGNVAGLLTIEGDVRAQPSFRWDGTARALDLAQLPPLTRQMDVPPNIVGMSVTGVADMDVESAWRDREAIRGNGDINLRLKTLVVKVPNTPMGPISVPLGDVSAHVTWQRGRAEVESLTIDGEAMQATGGGWALLGRNARLTRLNLQLEGTLGAKFPMQQLVTGMLGSGPLTLTIKGTAAQPVLYVNGKPLARLLGGSF